MEEIIKSYKGFNKDMTCKDKQYEVGKDYEEDKAVACECGMHACEYPLDCFKYYPPSKSVYCEVEQSGDISRHDDDSKIASTKMHIGAQLNIAGVVNAAIKYTKEKVKTTCIESKAATAGDYGAATAGYRGAATAGECGAATSRGKSSTGENGLSVARGNGVKAKGGIGSILVIAEEENSCKISNWKAVVVDGVNIKADTWYMLKDGELIEAED
ncbi:hypothetical protein DW839_32220 [Enterocloster bolteae]|uniref:DUF7666 domain-containing protein n=1 Tax=Enterocloster bolteae TaxID=208479 RepID=A0A414AEC9_9FIRM|nr:hypothetical protein DW839_32220 [Enterocloster bolteae]